MRAFQPAAAGPSRDVSASKSVPVPDVQTMVPYPFDQPVGRPLKPQNHSPYAIHTSRPARLPHSNAPRGHEVRTQVQDQARSFFANFAWSR